MRKTNPNVFKETWRSKQIRLKQEEQQKLDHATVRRGSFSWKEGEVMETLKEALNIRKVECRVETPDTVYCGSPKDLLAAISESELQLAVINKQLESLFGDKRWDIEVG